MRFIHMADVHLGAVPDSGCPWSAFRENEIWETFVRVIDQIREEKIELLLIAGDLFHRQPLMRELKEVNYLFSTLKNPYRIPRGCGWQEATIICGKTQRIVR